MPSEVSAYQSAKPATSSSARQTKSGACLRPPLPEPLADRIGLEHLRSQRGPDAAVQLEEARREADFRDVARPWQVDGELPDGARPRTRREEHDAIRERDRFLQI